MIEMIYDFNLLDIEDESFKSAHLAEGPGGFIEAINNFRKDLYSQVRKIHVTRFPYNAFLYPDLA